MPGLLQHGRCRHSKLVSLAAVVVGRRNNVDGILLGSGYFIKGQQYNVITHLVQQAWQQFIVVRAPVTAAAAIPSLMLPKLAYVMRISPPSPCLVNIIDYKGGSSSSSSRLVQGHEEHATQIM